MKKLGSIKKGISTLVIIICCSGMFLSCVQEEISPVYEKTELIDDTLIETEVIDGDGNDGNSNADGPRGKDHDVIDIDVAL